jgi:hypothetical protein
METRIGKMLPSAEEAQRSKVSSRDDLGRVKSKEKVLPIGMNGKRASQSRAIAKHPEIVEKVKAQGILMKPLVWAGRKSLLLRQPVKGNRRYPIDGIGEHGAHPHLFSFQHFFTPLTYLLNVL